jgi:hypothetical protein
MRMSDERTLKKIFSTKPDGTRSVGRLKLRWEDGVVQDMQILGVKRWKNVALNRDEWENVSRKTGSTRDCRTNDDDTMMHDQKNIKFCFFLVSFSLKLSFSWCLFKTLQFVCLVTKFSMRTSLVMPRSQYPEYRLS